MQTTKTVKTAWFFATLLCCGLGSAQAQTVTNADAAVALNLGGSWVGGNVPTSANVAVWDNTVQINTSKILGGNLSWAGIKILNPAGTITIQTNSAGNILTLGASGIDMSLATNGLTVSNAVALAADQTWNVTNGMTLNVGGVISGFNVLTLNNGLNNGGTVILAANNIFSNNVVISNGTVVPVTANSFGPATSGNVVTINGADLLLSVFPNSGIIANTFNVTGTNILDMVNRSVSVVLDGTFSNNGTIFITNDTASGSTLTFGGNGPSGSGSGNFNNFTGSLIVVSNASTTVSAGTIRFNNGGSSANIGNPGMTFDLGGGLTHFSEKNSGTTTSFGALFGGPGTMLVTSENYAIGALGLSNDVFSGTILSTSTFTKNGTGQFTWNNFTNNAFSGTTTVNAGILQIGDGVTLGAGSLGTGAITLAGGELLYNKPDAFAITNKITGSAGSLVKTNSSIMTYFGTNAASAATIISQGTLALGASGLVSSPVSMANGATFDVSQNPAFTLNQALSGFGTVNGLLTAVGGSINPGGSGVAGALTFNAGLTESGGVNNQLVLSTPGGANDLINVTGPLTLTGTNSFTLSCFGGGTIPNGTYPLIAYTGALSGDVTNFTVIALGVNGTLTNITTTTPPEIAVVISPSARGALNLTWTGDGAANNWDTATSNWVSGATSYAFQTGDNVLFNDSAFPNTNVDVAVPLVPAAVTVSNTQQYFLTGVGSINGDNTSLTKTNSGTLSISATNGYKGPTVVGGGTLEIFNIAGSGSASAIGAATTDPSNLVFYGSTFKYSGSSASTDRGATLNGAGVTVSVASGKTLTEYGTFAGPGALTLIGSGTLTLGGPSTYIGGTVISNGVLAAGSQTANASGFGTNAITFKGGTLALYQYNHDDGSTVFSFSNPLVVAAGQTGSFEVFMRGVVGSTLTGGGTINVTANGQRVGFGGDWSAFTGIINVVSNNVIGTNGIGTNFFRIDNALGYSNAVFNLNDLADLDGGGSGGSYSSSVTFDIGELDGTSLSTICSPAMSKATPYPTWRVGWKNTTSTFAGTIGNPVGGISSIAKVGTGTWFLLGQNTYTGSTVVSNGVLALSNNPATSLDGSIGSSTNIAVAAGAAIDVNGRSDKTLVLGASQVLQGNGVIKGILNTGSGVVCPGGGPGGSSGTLTVTNNVILGGTTWMKLNRASSPNSDQLVSSLGAINYGGTLTVTNIGAPLQKGDTFTLFNAKTLNGSDSSFTLNLPLYTTWDTSQLGANGSITFTGALPPPAIVGVVYTSLANGTLFLNVTNGLPNGYLEVLTTTNISLPLSSWTTNASSVGAWFESDGTLVDPNTGTPGGVTITVDTNLPQSFLVIKVHY